MHRRLAAATVGSVLALAVVAPASAAVVAEPIVLSAPDASLAITPVGTYETVVFDESAAEIVAHYAAGQRTLVVNAQRGAVDILDTSDPSAPVHAGVLEAAGTAVADGSTIPDGAVANSVAVRADGLAVVAIEAPVKTDPGWLLFADVTAAEAVVLGAIAVGSLPDSVVLSPDGTRAVVANEGEPADDYSVDPEGSVGVVDLPSAVAAAAQADYRTADFHAFEDGELPDGVRIYGGREDAGTGVPKHPVSENLEPEYSTIIGDRAYTTLQENNALAITDLRTATVKEIVPLETTDLREVPFDVSDRDGAINPRTWPVTAFRAPDTITSAQIDGVPYLVTANEGDLRDWDGYSEEARIKDFGDDGIAPLCPSVADGTGMTLDELTADDALGRLTATTADGLSADGDCFEEIHVSGSRSFSILDATGAEVFDSGSLFEEITAQAHPDFFHSNHSESSFDGRSDDKGVEPEAIAVGTVGDRTYAFIGFERTSGFVTMDISDPRAPEFVTYVNNRDFAVSAEDQPDSLAAAGDLGPESIVFVPGAEAPGTEDGTVADAMLIVGNEVSGSTTFYSVEDLLAAPQPSPTSTDQPDDESGDDDPAGEPTADPTAEPTTDPTRSPDSTESPEPTQSPTGDPSEPGQPEAGPEDDRLPRTGTAVASALGIAAALIGAGAVSLLIARRRTR